MNIQASIDGLGSQLKEARKGDQVLYYNKTSGLKALETGISIDVDGKMLTVTDAAAPVDILICRQDGVTVYSSKATTGLQTIELPGNGLYIVKAGQKTFKVII